jgi:hypothetical protein
LHGHAQQLVARGQQGVVALAAAVLQAEGEARAVPSSGIGGGLSGKMKASRMPDRPPWRARPAPGGVLLALALVPVLERDEGQAAFCPWPEN